MGDPIPVHFRVTPFKSPNIWKTHAEDDQEPRETDKDDPRENRPVAILKTHAERVAVLCSDGSSLGNLVKGGSFEGGRTRYYSGLPGGIGLYGYEIGEKARKKCGCEFVYLRAGNVILGPIHPAFRAGSFR